MAEVIKMPIDQAFKIIDGTLAQVNTNRENHSLIITAVERLREEIGTSQALLAALTADLHKAQEEYSRLLAESSPSDNGSFAGDHIRPA